jgi:hypothetical protein
MAQLRLSDKLQAEILEKIENSRKREPKFDVPVTQVAAFEKHFMKPGLVEWLEKCPDPETANKLVLTTNYYTHHYLHFDIKHGNHHLEVRYRPQYVATFYCQKEKDRYNLTPLAETFPFVKDFIAELLETSIHNERIIVLKDSLRKAMFNYTWANTFVKEVEQAKLFMPNWAIAKMEEKVVRDTEPKKQNKIAEEDLMALKQQLVSHAIVN